MNQYLNYANYLFTLGKKVENEQFKLKDVLKNLKFKNNTTKLTTNKILIISFEGERCSGKNTQIHLLKNCYKNQLFYIERTKNPAWEMLQTKKKNIYFNLDNIALDIFLFAADLYYRLGKALGNSDNKPIVFNRYIHSFFVIHRSLLLNRSFGDFKTFLHLIHLVTNFLPPPQIIFYLKIPKVEVYRRFFVSRNRKMNLEEKKICQFNLEGFNSIKDKNFIKINGCKNIQKIHQLIVKFLNKNNLVSNNKLFKF